jgi:oligopeptide transport system substrate-binding protein
VNTVTRAGELPARSFVPPGFPGYHSPLAPEYNPEVARRLLAEAGFPDGRGMQRIPILYNTDEAHQSIAELIQDQWKRALGIDVVPENQPWGSYQESQRNLRYSVCRAGWGGDYLDPNTFLDLFVTGGENNETGWSNADYDRLIEAAAHERDSTKRMELFRQAEAILLDEVPIIPIYFRVSKNLVRRYVQGFHNNLLDMHPLKAIKVDQAARRRMFNTLRERQKSEAAVKQRVENGA